MIKEIHKHIVITDDNDEYPIFDDRITVEEFNECVEHSRKIINEIKNEYAEVNDD